MKPNENITFFSEGGKSNKSFKKYECSLLNIGPKYSLYYKPKNWLKNLALETETAVNFLPVGPRPLQMVEC
jgi:hypothetical protein